MAKINKEKIKAVLSKPTNSDTWVQSLQHNQTTKAWALIQYYKNSIAAFGMLTKFSSLIIH